MKIFKGFLLKNFIIILENLIFLNNNKKTKKLILSKFI